MLAIYKSMTTILEISVKYSQYSVIYVLNLYSLLISEIIFYRNTKVPKY